MRIVEEREVAVTTIALMRGVVYRESDEDVWLALVRHVAAVRDHFAAIGVGVVVDDTEGYAYLKTVDDDPDDPLPRLVRRVPLSYNLSLLLVLLRRRLLEFESTTGEGVLVVSRADMVETLRLFLDDATNEARVVDKVDTTVKKAVELGFLRPLRGQTDQWEVRRVLKAYVDAQTLGDFAAKLAEYAQTKEATGE
ncbi:MAG: DUF4194 domain-containing protein [Micrococcales bacterium]|nr:DUF4194 domain-containing protein [Micrococcales bacterium]